MKGSLPEMFVVRIRRVTFRAEGFVVFDTNVTPLHDLLEMATGQQRGIIRYRCIAILG